MTKTCESISYGKRFILNLKISDTYLFDRMSSLRVSIGDRLKFIRLEKWKDEHRAKNWFKTKVGATISNMPE